MGRLGKPWLLALIVALCLHGLFFLGFKDRHWGIDALPKAPPQLNVSIIPADTEDSQPEPPIEAPQTAFTEPEDAPIDNTSVNDTPVPNSIPSQPSNPMPADLLAPVSTETPVAPTSTPASTANVRQRAVSLREIDQLQQGLDQLPENWKQDSLLDIGNDKNRENTVDTAKAAFSPNFRQALSEAKNLQAEYKKGVIQEHDYPITEDADGTRYVNIKGVCWKLPEPGSYGEWQVVLSGCSGQQHTFRFELNITTDILRSDMFNDLPFSIPER
ncbi:hypothetical protein [Marinomonas ostreistagni]|uniref:hypothetical protein n=1 Tax=Marinomonas ostreistagni TaxID=359209 RepID=UPI00195108B2|nr:hypothetical protein [Marinomonas ostreistagni]MBM6551318.1 hypothetical protein [Marinomonas ostreistagni]